MQLHLPCEQLGLDNNQDLPLVLIPGVGADNRTWASARVELAKKFHVIALNNRGVGILQDLKPYSTFDMMNDVVKQLDDLQIEQAYILGHSMGGCVAQLLAIHHPERVKKLILVSTRAYFSKKSVFYYDLIIKLMEQGLPRELLIHNTFLWLFGATFFEEEAQAKSLIKLAAAMPANASVHNFRLQVQAAMAHDSRALTHQIQAPTLVMIGAEDVMCLAKYSYELVNDIPDAEVTVLETAGHMPFLEESDLFQAKVIQFLTKD